MLVLSFDLETNGLHGETIAIAAIVRRDGETVGIFEGRTPNPIHPFDQWIVDNILPAIGGMTVTHPTAEALEETFWEFYLAWKEQGAILIAHCCWPVETGVFHRMVARRFSERQWQGPYPALHDVATVLLLAGEQPDSTEQYLTTHRLQVPFAGSPHHPMYDAVSAVIVWEHAIWRLSTGS